MREEWQVDVPLRGGQIFVGRQLGRSRACRLIPDQQRCVPANSGLRIYNPLTTDGVTEEVLEQVYSVSTLLDLKALLRMS